MEKSKCKSHMITTLPDPTQQLAETELTESASSFSSSSFECDVEEQDHNKSLAVYKLRENPKRSFKLQDPEFATSLDKESETESTRKRSKLTRKECNKVEFTESEQQQLSSVSDASPEEALAMCLLLLSKDNNFTRRNNRNPKEEKEDRKKKNKRVFLNGRKDKLRCEKCTKQYRSLRALSAHKRICSLDVTKLTSTNSNKEKVGNNVEESIIFQCPYCDKLFGSGQALGGHKRSHLGASSSYNVGGKVGGKFEVRVREVPRSCLIDLNLPASLEDEEFSVVSEE